MSELVYLDLDDLMAAARAYLGRSPEVRDFGLLESALLRPQASVFGEDAYPGIHAKAAALLHSLVTNHGLVDGNKRLGYVAMRLFYEINGYRVVASADEKVDLVVEIADGTLSDVNVIAKRLTLWARRSQPPAHTPPSPSVGPLEDDDEDQDENVLNQEAAAKFLGVSQRTLRRLQAGGKVPFYRLSDRRVRYDRQELSAWLDERARGKRTGS